MNTRLKTILAIGILAGFAMPASALPLLEIVSDGDTVHDTLPPFDYHASRSTVGMDGYYNANLKALLGAQLEMVFIYGDSIATTNLVVGGSLVPTSGFDHPTYTVDGGATQPGDWVDFAIRVLDVHGAQIVENGSNNYFFPHGAPNFWLGYTDETHNKVIVAVEDGELDTGTVGDYDDLVFMIQAKPVSEPATLTLLGAGLLLTGFGVRTRRRYHGSQKMA